MPLVCDETVEYSKKTLAPDGPAHEMEESKCQIVFLFFFVFLYEPVFRYVSLTYSVSEYHIVTTTTSTT